MDKRLIFRYRSWTIQSQLCAGCARPSVALELLRLTVRAIDLRIRRRGRGKLAKGNSVNARLQEKHGWGCHERPYRKPTLVAGHKCAKVDE
jgi:hypothetical protein